MATRLRKLSRSHQLEIHTGSSWMLTFSDLTLLLLTMFVLLFANSKPKTELIHPLNSYFSLEKNDSLKINQLPSEAEIILVSEEKEKLARNTFITLKTEISKAAGLPLYFNNSSYTFPGDIKLTKFENSIELSLPLSTPSIREIDTLNTFIKLLKTRLSSLSLLIHTENNSINSVNFQDTKQIKMLFKLIYLRQLLDAGISKESLVSLEELSIEEGGLKSGVYFRAIFK